LQGDAIDVVIRREGAERFIEEPPRATLRS
jgi:hypothetical protein